MFKISVPVLVRALPIDWLILVIFLYPLTCDRSNKVRFWGEAISLSTGDHQRLSTCDNSCICPPGRRHATC